MFLTTNLFVLPFGEGPNADVPQVRTSNIELKVALREVSQILNIKRAKVYSFALFYHSALDFNALNVFNYQLIGCNSK
jgi:NADH:ubiquinone oxidoreductase subunit E